MVEFLSLFLEDNIYLKIDRYSYVIFHICTYLPLILNPLMNSFLLDSVLQSYFRERSSQESLTNLDFETIQLRLLSSRETIL